MLSTGFISTGFVGSRGVVGINLTTLTPAFNEVMLVRRYIVGIGLAALALALNKGMLVRRYVVGISFTALALAFNGSMLVRRYVVGIGLADISTTNIYVHALESTDRMAAQMFDNFLKKKNI